MPPRCCYRCALAFTFLVYSTFRSSAHGKLSRRASSRTAALNGPVNASYGVKFTIHSTRTSISNENPVYSNGTAYRSCFVFEKIQAKQYWSVDRKDTRVVFFFVDPRCPEVLSVRSFPRQPPPRVHSSTVTILPAQSRYYTIPGSSRPNKWTLEHPSKWSRC